jgi:hypothetical protein
MASSFESQEDARFRREVAELEQCVVVYFTRLFSDPFAELARPPLCR